MKFMITFTYSQGNFLQTQKAWASRSTQADEKGLKLLGRWHDMVRRRAVHIFEADDMTAVARFFGPWNSLGDIDITPVLDDEESAAVARQIVADLKV